MAESQKYLAELFETVPRIDSQEIISRFECYLNERFAVTDDPKKLSRDEKKENFIKAGYRFFTANDRKIRKPAK
jgi:hypothetical protein